MLSIAVNVLRTPGSSVICAVLLGPSASLNCLAIPVICSSVISGFCCLRISIVFSDAERWRPDGENVSAIPFALLAAYLNPGAGPVRPPINSDTIPAPSLPGKRVSDPVRATPAPKADVPSIVAILPGLRAVDLTISDANCLTVLPLGAVCISACAGVKVRAAANGTAAIPVTSPTVCPPLANALWSTGKSDKSVYPIPPASNVLAIDLDPPLKSGGTSMKSSGTPIASRP